MVFSRISEEALWPESLKKHKMALAFEIFLEFLCPLPQYYLKQPWQKDWCCWWWCDADVVWNWCWCGADVMWSWCWCGTDIGVQLILCGADIGVVLMLCGADIGVVLILVVLMLVWSWCWCGADGSVVSTQKPSCTTFSSRLYGFHLWYPLSQGEELRFTKLKQLTKEFAASRVYPIQKSLLTTCVKQFELFRIRAQSC